jgi:hypothetical protein
MVIMLSALFKYIQGFLVKLNFFAESINSTEISHFFSLLCSKSPGKYRHILVGTDLVPHGAHRRPWYSVRDAPKMMMMIIILL